jgi:hypothetical protein
MSKRSRGDFIFLIFFYFVCKQVACQVSTFAIQELCQVSCCKSLRIKHLGGPGARKSLVFNNLGVDFTLSPRCKWYIYT